MANLLTEYRERHKTNFILPIDEGVCFFNLNKKPHLICLTSSLSRNYSTCRQCLKHIGGLIAEVFLYNSTNYFSLIKHEHIDPDLDLGNFVNKVTNEKLIPFVAYSEIDVECWLWNFYLSNYEVFLRKWENKVEPCRMLEQVSFCFQDRGNFKHLETFYTKFYQTFLLGRKYILFG